MLYSASNFASRWVRNLYCPYIAFTELDPRSLQQFSFKDLGALFCSFYRFLQSTFSMGICFLCIWELFPALYIDLQRHSLCAFTVKYLGDIFLLFICFYRALHTNLFSLIWELSRALYMGFPKHILHVSLLLEVL